MLLILLLGFSFFYCEYLIYFPAILKCSWPGTGLGKSPDGRPVDPLVRAMVLSDTHLLGAVGGHWFDKLRREWQMERAFQTALWLLKPEIVFILGDIFDEGKWSSQKHWEDDVRRFHRMFRHSPDTQLVVLVGNHDIGFHYEECQNSRFWETSVILRSICSHGLMRLKISSFLLLNSVALHGDGCPICQSVETELIRLSREMNCSLQDPDGGAAQGCEGPRLHAPSSPIMLQHYPLYRVSDAACTGLDAAPAEDRHLLFREKYDVLSKEASQRLLWWFRPRLILSGHTHSGCEVLHDNKYPEISVPSFSWRNRNNPSFIMLSVSADTFGLSKCFLPEESTVIHVYCLAGACTMLLLLAHCLWMKGLLQCLSLLGKHKYM
uniref:Metallophosphoesterase 1 n=1 Tax=Tetraodon nigroviridis TaxID=99883 RepID=H3DBK3_TETNG